MRIVVLDYETYYADDFTLSKMTTEAYIRDPRFVAHGAAIKWSPHHQARWYWGRDLPGVLAQEDWSDVFLINHHAQFDSLILSHHYGVRPKMIGCTLSMARLLLGNHISVSLDSVRAHFGLPAKKTPYHLFRGKRTQELDANARQLLAEGCEDEVESIYWLFSEMLKGTHTDPFPVEELEVISHTVKMFTEPTLETNMELLAKIWEDEAAAKQARAVALQERLGFSRLDDVYTALQSSDKFAALLVEAGVEPDTKPGKPKADGTPKPIYAFAKTDPFMEDLLESEDAHLKALAEARVGAKSSTNQTRAATIGHMANRGPLCVYLHMYGAHTTRWSGGDKCLVADTRVLVFDPQKGLTEKLIVDILLDDLIWDGEEFVAHSGVVFSGYQNTIEYDGIEATPEHIVFTEVGEIRLSEAAERGARLMDCRQPTDREVDTVARGQYHARTVPLRMRGGKND